MNKSEKMQKIVKNLVDARKRYSLETTYEERNNTLIQRNSMLIQFLKILEDVGEIEQITLASVINEFGKEKRELMGEILKFSREKKNNV